MKKKKKNINSKPKKKNAQEEPMEFEYLYKHEKRYNNYLNEQKNKKITHIIITRK